MFLSVLIASKMNQMILDNVDNSSILLLVFVIAVVVVVVVRCCCCKSVKLFVDSGLICTLLLTGQVFSCAKSFCEILDELVQIVTGYFQPHIQQLRSLIIYLYLIIHRRPFSDHHLREKQHYI